MFLKDRGVIDDLSFGLDPAGRTAKAELVREVHGAQVKDGWAADKLGSSAHFRIRRILAII